MIIRATYLRRDTTLESKHAAGGNSSTAYAPVVVASTYSSETYRYLSSSGRKPNNYCSELYLYGHAVLQLSFFSFTFESATRRCPGPSGYKRSSFYRDLFIPLAGQSIAKFYTRVVDNNKRSFLKIHWFLRGDWNFTWGRSVTLEFR